MIERVLSVCALALAVAACASQQAQYEWGPYEDTLFVHYHEPALKAESLSRYLEFLAQDNTYARPIAPGLFAEAGTFMLEQGDAVRALEFYRLEYAAWPESRPMLEVLIRNLEERADG